MQRTGGRQRLAEVVLFIARRARCSSLGHGGLFLATLDRIHLLPVPVVPQQPSARTSAAVTELSLTVSSEKSVAV